MKLKEIINLLEEINNTSYEIYWQQDENKLESSKPYTILNTTDEEDAKRIFKEKKKVYFGQILVKNENGKKTVLAGHYDTSD